MKRIKLSSDTTQEFKALGIACHEKDYRLSFGINRVLQFNLEKTDDLVFHNPTPETNMKIPCHYYADTENNRSFYLLKNKQESGYLLPRFQAADYIFILNPIPDEQFQARLKKDLGNIASIQSIFTIPDDQLKYINIDAE